MSYGIEATQSFMTVAPTAATNGVQPPKLDDLGHSMSVRNFEDALRAANAPVTVDIQLAQADPTTAVPGATATDMVAPVLTAPGTPPVSGVTPGTETDAGIRAAEGLGRATGDDGRIGRLHNCARLSIKPMNGQIRRMFLVHVEQLHAQIGMGNRHYTGCNESCGTA